MTDGIKGIGYIVQPRGDLMRTIAAGAGELSKGLPGMDVRYTEAIWDALGKTLGQPIFRFLGVYRNEVVAYATDRMRYSVPIDDL